MWNWFNCYLSGRHEYGPWCEPGTIFLRCVHCGRRTSGWAIEAKGKPIPITHAHAKPMFTTTPQVARVVPFQRTAAQ
jgi:hypothetical protein